MTPQVKTLLFLSSSVCKYICFVNKFICIMFYIPHINDSFGVYLWLTSLTMIISRSIHVTAKAIISLFLYS